MMAVYFKIADKYNIIDKPNERSSHTRITVRGGGIIFPIAAFFSAIFLGFDHYWFLLGLLSISVVSFIDDIMELNRKIRIVVQLIAVLLMFVDLNLFSAPIYAYVPVVVFALAMLNAWNFMDGINGITGGYSLLTIGTFIYLNEQALEFTSTSFLVTIALSLLVFIFYNFRTKAKCFAGDIGSVSIAFIILFLMIRLIAVSGNFNYILLILLYGLDSTTTVFFRALRKENVLDAHRSHLYQYLANDMRIAHNKVTLIYIFIQLLINLGVVFFAIKGLSTFVICTLIGLVLFITVRFTLEGKAKILGKI
jgi:UDP-GlcNAc:undecaprenyl-phosphate GlcNAc-1-phosphate transferase